MQNLLEYASYQQHSVPPSNMTSNDSYLKSLREFEKKYDDLGSVPFSKDFSLRVQTFRHLLLTLTNLTTATDSATSVSLENSIRSILDTFQKSILKINKIASITPWISYSPWNRPQQRQLSDELVVQLGTVDTFLSQLQHSILLLTLQQSHTNQLEDTASDLLKVFDFDACKNFWKEKIGLHVTKLSIPQFSELFLHMITSMKPASGQAYSPEVFLTRVLAHTFDRNDDHEISMIELNTRVQELLKQSIPTPLQRTSSDETFWLALGKYLDHVQAQYRQLIHVQPVEAPTSQRVYVKPFESYRFRVTLPHFEPKETYPLDYITLIQYPPTSIHSIEDVFTTAHASTVLAQAKEIPASRGYFSSLHHNLALHGKWKDAWTIQHYEKEYLDRSDALFAPRESAFTTLPSSVYGYEQLQSLSFLLHHTSIRSVVAFDYLPTFPAPGVYSYRIALPSTAGVAGVDVVQQATTSFYTRSHDSAASAWIPDLFTPQASQTIERFLSSSSSSSETMNHYLALVEALFSVEKQALLLSRQAHDYHHIEYLTGLLTEVKAAYEAKVQASPREGGESRESSRLPSHSAAAVPSITTQAKFLQRYSSSIVSIPHLLTEIHRLLSSFLWTTLDLTHPQIQAVLTQVLTLCQVIRTYENMTDEDVNLVVALSHDMQEVLNHFIALKTTEKNPQITMQLIVQQIHSLLDVAMEKTITQQHVIFRDANALCTIIHQYIQQMYTSEADEAHSRAITKELFSAVYKYLWNGVMKTDTTEANELFGGSKEDSQGHGNALVKICDFIQHQRTIKLATTQTLSLLTTLQSTLAGIASTWETFLASQTTQPPEESVTTIIPATATASTNCCLPFFASTAKPTPLPEEESLPEKKPLIVPKLTHYYRTVDEIVSFGRELDINTRYYHTLIYIDNNQYLPTAAAGEIGSDTHHHLRYEAMALLWQRLAFALELQSFVTNVWVVALKKELDLWYTTSHDVALETPSSSFSMQELALLLEVFQYFDSLQTYLTPTVDTTTGILAPAEYLSPQPILKAVVKNAAKLAPAEQKASALSPCKKTLQISINHLATVLHHLEHSDLQNFARTVSTMSIHSLASKDPVHMALQYASTLRSLIMFAIQNIASSSLLSGLKRRAQHSFSRQQTYLIYLQQLIVYLDHEITRLQEITVFASSAVVTSPMEGIPRTTTQIIDDILSLNKILRELQFLVSSSSPNAANPLSLENLTLLMEAIQEIDVFYQAMTDYIFFSPYELEELQLLDRFVLIDHNSLPSPQDLFVEVQDVSNVVWCAEKVDEESSVVLSGKTLPSPVQLPIGQTKAILSATEYVHPFVPPHHPAKLPYQPILSADPTEVITIKPKKYYATDAGKTLFLTKAELEDPQTVLYLALHIPSYELTFPSSTTREENEVYHLQMKVVYRYPDPYEVGRLYEKQETLFFTDLMMTNQRSVVIPLHFLAQYPCDGKQSVGVQEVVIACQPILPTGNILAPEEIDPTKPRLAEYTMKLIIQDAVECVIPSGPLAAQPLSKEVEEEGEEVVRVVRSREEYVWQEEDTDVRTMVKKFTTTTTSRRDHQWLESLVDEDHQEVVLTRTQPLPELLQHHDPMALAKHATTIYPVLPKTLFVPSIQPHHLFTRKEHVNFSSSSLHSHSALTPGLRRSLSRVEAEGLQSELDGESGESKESSTSSNRFYQCAACRQTGFGYLYVCDVTQQTLHIQCAIDLVSQRMYAEDIAATYDSNHQNLVLSDHPMTLCHPSVGNNDGDSTQPAVRWYGCDLCHCNLYDVYYSYQDHLVHPQCATYGVLPPKFAKVTDPAATEVADENMTDLETSQFSTANPMAATTPATFTTTKKLKKEMVFEDRDWNPPETSPSDDEEGSLIASSEKDEEEGEEVEEEEEGIDKELSYSLSPSHPKQRKLLRDDDGEEDEDELSLQASPVAHSPVGTVSSPVTDSPAVFETLAPQTTSTIEEVTTTKKLQKKISFADREWIPPKPSDSDDEAEVIILEDEEEQGNTVSSGAKKALKKNISFQDRTLLKPVYVEGQRPNEESDNEEDATVIIESDDEQPQRPTSVEMKKLQKKISFADRVLVVPIKSEASDDEEEDNAIIVSDDDEEEGREKTVMTIEEVEEEQQIRMEESGSDSEQSSPRASSQQTVVVTSTPSTPSRHTGTSQPITPDRTPVRRPSLDPSFGRIVPEIDPTSAQTPVFAHRAPYKTLSDVQLRPTPKRLSSTSDEYITDMKGVVLLDEGANEGGSDVEGRSGKNEGVEVKEEVTTTTTTGQSHHHHHRPHHHHHHHADFQEQSSSSFTSPSARHDHDHVHRDEITIITTTTTTAVETASQPSVDFSSPSPKSATTAVTTPGGGMVRRGSVGMVEVIPTVQTPVFAHRAPYKTLSDVQLRPTPKKEPSESK